MKMLIVLKVIETKKECFATVDFLNAVVAMI